MKRPVSFVSLVLAFGLAASCGATKIDKAEFAQLCAKRMGSAEKCGCYADNVQKALTPELFDKVALAVHETKDLGGTDWIPESVRRDETINAALGEAMKTCFGA
jgi:hypothetical protein